MKRWFDPLSNSIFKNKDNLAHWTIFPSWMLVDAFICLSENGFMQKDINHFEIDHLARYVSGESPKGKIVLLILDGHKSRNGLSWLQKGRRITFKWYKRLLIHLIYTSL